MKNPSRRNTNLANSGGAKRQARKPSGWKPSEKQIREVTRIVVEVNREALQELEHH